MTNKDIVVRRIIEDYGPNNKVCIDLGPGSGRWLRFLKSLGPKKLLASDFDKGKKKNCLKYADFFKVSDFEIDRLSFKDNTCDLIIITEVLEHIRNYNFFLSEVLRISRNDALIILTMPNVCSFISRIRVIFGLLPVAIASDDTHVNFFRKKDINRIFQKFNQRVIFYNSSFSINPLKPKSKFRIKSISPLGGLDDSFIFTIRVKK